MGFIAITSTASDHSHKADLPRTFPVLCKEYPTKEEAEKAHPGCRVMSVEQYKGYKEGMDIAAGHALDAADLTEQLRQQQTKMERLKNRGFWARITNKEVL